MALGYMLDEKHFLEAKMPLKETPNGLIGAVIIDKWSWKETRHDWLVMFVLSKNGKDLPAPEAIRMAKGALIEDEEHKYLKGIIPKMRPPYESRQEQFEHFFRQAKNKVDQIDKKYNR